MNEKAEDSEPVNILKEVESAARDIPGDPSIVPNMMSSIEPSRSPTSWPRHMSPTVMPLTMPPGASQYHQAQAAHALHGDSGGEGEAGGVSPHSAGHGGG